MKVGQIVIVKEPNLNALALVISYFKILLTHISKNYFMKKNETFI